MNGMADMVDREERKKLVMQLAQGLKIMTPTLEPAAILQIAQSFEKQSFDNSSSKHEYLATCYSKLAQINSGTVSVPLDNDRMHSQQQQQQPQPSQQQLQHMQMMSNQTQQNRMQQQQQALNLQQLNQMMVMNMNGNGQAGQMPVQSPTAAQMRSSGNFGNGVMANPMSPGMGSTGMNDISTPFLQSYVPPQNAQLPANQQMSMNPIQFQQAMNHASLQNNNMQSMPLQTMAPSSYNPQYQATLQQYVNSTHADDTQNRTLQFVNAMQQQQQQQQYQQLHQSQPQAGQSQNNAISQQKQAQAQAEMHKFFQQQQQQQQQQQHQHQQQQRQQGGALQSMPMLNQPIREKQINAQYMPQNINAANVPNAHQRMQMILAKIQHQNPGMSPEEIVQRAKMQLSQQRSFATNQSRDRGDGMQTPQQSAQSVFRAQAPPAMQQPVVQQDSRKQPNQPQRQAAGRNAADIDLRTIPIPRQLLSQIPNLTPTITTWAQISELAKQGSFDPQMMLTIKRVYAAHQAIFPQQRQQLIERQEQSQAQQMIGQITLPSTMNTPNAQAQAQAQALQQSILNQTPIVTAPGPRQQQTAQPTTQRAARPGRPANKRGRKPTNQNQPANPPNNPAPNGKVQQLQQSGLLPQAFLTPEESSPLNVTNSPSASAETNVINRILAGQGKEAAALSAARLKMIQEEVQLNPVRNRTLTNLTVEEKRLVAETCKGMMQMYSRIDQLLPLFFMLTSNEEATRRLVQMKLMYKEQFDNLARGTYTCTAQHLEKLKEQIGRYFTFVKNQVQSTGQKIPQSNAPQAVPSPLMQMPQLSSESPDGVTAAAFVRSSMTQDNLKLPQPKKIKSSSSPAETPQLAKKSPPTAQFRSVKKENDNPLDFALRALSGHLSQPTPPRDKANTTTPMSKAGITPTALLKTPQPFVALGKEDEPITPPDSEGKTAAEALREEFSSLADVGAGLDDKVVHELQDVSLDWDPFDLNKGVDMSDMTWDQEPVFSISV